MIPDPIPEITALLAPTGVPVVTLIPPKQGPKELIRIAPAGGDGVGPWLAQVLVTVEAWADTPRRARELALHARTLLLTGAETNDLIHDAEATWPAALPDPDTPTQRAVFTAQLTIL
ncbi:MAG: hypothetical protein Q4D96_02900 [Propionibacteriaceae bacterium]|nr:hypothetical protein [Propionibacteriaceae bacterium]